MDKGGTGATLKGTGVVAVWPDELAWSESLASESDEIPFILRRIHLLAWTQARSTSM